MKVKNPYLCLKCKQQFPTRQALQQHSCGGMSQDELDLEGKAAVERDKPKRGRAGNQDD